MTIDDYKKLNDSFEKMCVYHVGLSAGFFSEYNSMILAMGYCLTHRIRFVLQGGHANFGDDKGWEDFFEPFCELDYNDKNKHYRTVNWKYAIKYILTVGGEPS
jgi:hypothetical protein